MKLFVLAICTVTLVPLAFLACSPDQQLQQYEKTLREYQNIIVNYQNEVNSLQAQLTSQKQLAAEYQRAFEDISTQKEQMESKYKSQVDQLNQRITELQNKVDSLEGYQSTYSPTEVRAIVQEHERAQEWIRGDETLPYVNRIRWQSGYQGSGNWVVTMSIEGEVQCFIVFGFNEQSEQVTVIRDGCP
jgi:septal ring factor EnvC (AmiA/AmiB activator)